MPTSEILRYAIDLRSMTGGRGRFTADARPLRRDAVAPRRQASEAEGRSALSDLSPADAVVAARSFARRLQGGDRGRATGGRRARRRRSETSHLASPTVLDDTTRRLGGSPRSAWRGDPIEAVASAANALVAAIGTYAADDWNARSRRHAGDRCAARRCRRSRQPRAPSDASHRAVRASGKNLRRAVETAPSAPSYGSSRHPGGAEEEPDEVHAADLQRS